MRKFLLISSLLLFSLFVLVACGSAEDEADENRDTEEATEETENEEKAEEASGEEDEDNNQNEEAIEEDEEENNEEILYEINEGNWSVVPIDDADSEVALITIDDAPDEHALKRAETLKELEAPAIFFVNGHLFESDEKKEVLKEIHELGFMIGNHTYSHENLTTLTEEEQHDEIVEVSDMVEEVIGERPKFFRAPFGENTDYTKSVAKDEGMVLMNWTYGYDWDAEYQTKEAITDIMLNAEELNDGANLLMHDREWTNAALEDIVTGLRDKGYEFVDPYRIEHIQ